MTLGISTFVLLAGCLVAQEITLVAPSEIAKEIANQRKLVEQAWREWESSDEGLERSLFTAPADRVLARIEAGRRHAVAYHQQRARFLQTLITALAREIASLEQALPEASPPLLAPDARKLDILLDHQKRLASRARAAGLSLLEQRWLGEQSRLLGQLAENIAAQHALYQAFKDSEEHNRKARRALTESYRALTQLLEEQIRINEQKRDLWVQYYDSLRELLESRKPAATAPKARRAEERK